MKTEESYCINSNYMGGGCQKANDEVVTKFEYEDDNLNLTGITVTSGGKAHRTCYQYDKLGNRVSTTKPRANLTSCSQ